MRGTLHLLAAGDLFWLLLLLTPVLIRKTRRRYAELGLTDAVCSRAMKVIREAIDGHLGLTRSELAERLAAEGIPAQGQAAYHLVRRAALEGILCVGADREKEPTYVLLEDRMELKGTVEMDEASSNLVRRYIEAFGPAGPEDLASWSGLPLKEVRIGFETIRTELVELETRGASIWFLKNRLDWLDSERVIPSGRPSVSLLPAYDPLLLGYRSREMFLDPHYLRRVHPGGGVIRPVLLVDGQVRGTWRLVRSKSPWIVAVQPFDRFSRDVEARLENEAADVGRFFETETVLQVRGD
jgi:hypothetical protein